MSNILFVHNGDAVRKIYRASLGSSALALGEVFFERIEEGLARLEGITDGVIVFPQGRRAVEHDVDRNHQLLVEQGRLYRFNAAVTGFSVEPVALVALALPLAVAILDLAGESCEMLDPAIDGMMENVGRTAQRLGELGEIPPAYIRVVSSADLVQRTSIRVASTPGHVPQWFKESFATAASA